MKPNFALDLSEDGIVLLHRADKGDGWVKLREVSLDSASLARDLHGLRDVAVGLEGEDFTSKLILPPSQLLYATVEVEGDTRKSVEDALEDRTPYLTSQLVYDTSGKVSGSNREVKVVAVARETLSEAEGFLAPYHLNAIGFTALPEPGHFDGEPNLGPSKFGAEMGFEVDTSPVRIVEPSDVKAPEPAPDLAAKPETPPEFSAPDETKPEPKPKPAAKAKAATPEPEVEAPVTPEPDKTPSAPAAFSSRRLETSEDAEAGKRVTQLAARIGIPEAAPKISAPITTPKTQPLARIKPKQIAVPASAVVDGKVDPLVLKQVTSGDPLGGIATKQLNENSRRTGLILTLILIVALGLLALLSSLLLPAETLARLLGRAPAPEIALTEDVKPDLQVELAQDIALLAEPEFSEIELTSLPSGTTLPELDEPVLLAPSDQFVVVEEADTPATPPAPGSQLEAETAYAVSGIWQLAPDLSRATLPQDLGDLYIASIDPKLEFEDAPALRDLASRTQDVAIKSPFSPPPPGTKFVLGEDGLVKPTRDGAMNVNGVMIFAGPPPVPALPRPEGITVPEAAPIVVDQRLAQFRPRARPDDLVERLERANFGGLSRRQLAALRPIQRPANAQAQAEAIARAVAEAAAESAQAAQEALDAPTVRAVARSVRPASRPREIETLVARATPRENSNEAQAASTAAVIRAPGPAVARSNRATPTAPTRPTVARAATDNNALSLGRVALIGVFGTSSDRRALVRMPNGKFKKVSVGDRVDGGRVAAIDEGSLRYTKSGRTVTLKMPQG
jgi:hypothetical protein